MFDSTSAVVSVDVIAISAEPHGGYDRAAPGPSKLSRLRTNKIESALHVAR